MWRCIISDFRRVADNKLVVYNIAYRSFCSKADGWIHLKGDIEAPQEGKTVAIWGHDFMVGASSSRVRFTVYLSLTGDVKSRRKGRLSSLPIRGDDDCDALSERKCKSISVRKGIIRAHYGRWCPWWSAWRKLEEPSYRCLIFFWPFWEAWQWR